MFFFEKGKLYGVLFGYIAVKRVYFRNVQRNGCREESIFRKDGETSQICAGIA